MSVSYRPVLWNKFKVQYDAIVWGTILLYLVIFIGTTVLKYPAQNLMTTLIRVFGSLGVLLLHVILVIGPLSRISNRFLPILYNRRHLGVSMFIITTVHSVLSLLQFHGNGNVHPLISVFTSNQHYDSLIYFPFQTLGFFALIILAAMAFTSHDFWLHFLHPKCWKILHMLVYVAYGLVMLHVALGILQFEKSPILVAFLMAGFVTVAGLHLYTALKENKEDNRPAEKLAEEWQYVCTTDEIQEGKARLAIVNKERVAVFKYNGKLSAVHNVCKHQMGPLGEGKIIDGCITCPWHGYQYRPEDGCAPSPFTEKIATYRLQLIGKKIFVNTSSLPEGSFVEPIRVHDVAAEKIRSPFFVGWSGDHIAGSKAVVLPAVLAASFILITGWAISNSQEKISGFTIDYSQVKKMEGWLSVKPVPNLRIIDGHDDYGNPVFKTILLIDAFKFGADGVVEKVLRGDSVKYVGLTGYLNSNVTACTDSSGDCVEKCQQCIIGTTNNPVMEIENGQYSFVPLKAPLLAETRLIRLGRQILRGEIIDPKCYFGAMNPGNGKAHLSCAVRCISGGIMPVLKYQVNSQNRYAVLVGFDGSKINSAVLDIVGLPVEVNGDLATIDNWGVLYIDLAKGVRRLKGY